MPYGSISELPANIKKLPEAKQRQWMHIWNSAYARCKAKNLRSNCESFAFANANGVVLKNLSEEEIERIESLDAKPEVKKRIYEILSKVTPEDDYKDVKTKLALFNTEDKPGFGGGTGEGPGGKCICPKCGYEESHDKAEPCNQRKCPKCGTVMTRKIDKENSDSYKYTLDSLMDQILLVSNHCENYLGGKMQNLCEDCIKSKHLPTIRALLKEGTSLTSNTNRKDKFVEYANTVNEIMDLMNTSVTKESIQKLQDTMRNIRKDMELNLYTTVLSDEAMKIGWVPEKGISGLPKDIESKIPEAYIYWTLDDKGKRIEGRNKVVEAIRLGIFELNLDDHVFPTESPYEPTMIREEDKDLEHSVDMRSVWRYHQDAKRVEIEGILLSYGAWNGYYYPPEVIDNFNASQIIGMPICFEHGKEVGKYIYAKNDTKEHNIYVKGWIDDPTTVDAILTKKCTGLSPKLAFKADDSRKTVKSISRMIEGSVVENPACKVCFIEHVS